MSDMTFIRRQNHPFVRALERLWYLMKLHLAMIAGTLLGLGVLGFFPSLFAASELVDDLLSSGEGYVFGPFFVAWKKNFKPANLFALFVYLSLGIGFAIWYGLWYVRTPIAATLGNALFFLLVLAFLVIILYYPVIRIHFTRWTMRTRVLYTLLFGFGHFLTTLLLLILAVAWGLFAAFFPQYAIFVLFSIIPYVAVIMTRRHLPVANHHPAEPAVTDSFRT